MLKHRAIERYGLKVQRFWMFYIGLCRKRLNRSGAWRDDQLLRVEAFFQVVLGRRNCNSCLPS
jgi:hypothetical protein